jgi:ribosome maturation factor RimP
MIYDIMYYRFTRKWATQPTFLLGVNRPVANDAEIVEKVKGVVKPIIESEGLELVDIEYRREHRGRVLRLFIDREGGVNLGDCASISREIDKNLQIEAIPPGPYTLEVSSPGLNRPLKKESDFHRFNEHRVKLKTAVPIQDRRTFKGRLLACRDGIIEVEEEKGVVRIPLAQIAKANLEYEF